jgi:1-acyl-sn-glycerol-3-phosphate acyltransferase
MRSTTTVTSTAAADDERVYRVLATSLHVTLSPFIRRDWRRQDRVPQNGGVLLVANHLSNIDPILMGEYLVYSGRWPRYLGKEELWHVPGIGWLGRHCGQIPIQRASATAGVGLQNAIDALKAGEAVVIYPEATRGADPQGWPMTARSGAARVALAARCPVVPLGQTGADRMLPAHGFHLPRLLPRTTISILCGEPLHLDDLYDSFRPGLVPGIADAVRPHTTEQEIAEQARSHEAIVEAGARMIDAITDLVAEIRNEPAPPDRYDPRQKIRVPRPEPPNWLG